MFNKAYEELTFSDDFMFCKVLQNNPDLCKELLELILGEPIGELVTVEKQHAIDITPDGRGVRFDVCARDDASVIYDVEMQNARKDHLPKRARYLSGMIDLDMLERGSHFRELRKSYVIFICRFNLMPEIGRHRYSFRNICLEDRELELGDETEKIFLCTEGTADDVSPEMKQFLSYVADESKEGEFAIRLEEAVRTAKKHPQWRKDYMDLMDYIEDAKAEGIEQGRAEGIEKGRSEGIDQGRTLERLSAIQSLMTTMKWTEKQAMDALGIPQADQTNYINILKQSIQ